MHDVAVARDLVRQIVPRDHMSIKEWISATAHHLGWSFGRTKNIWYGEARRIDGFEKDALRRAKAQKRQHTIEEIRREQKRLRDELSALDETLAALDTRQARVMGAGQGA